MKTPPACRLLPAPLKALIGGAGDRRASLSPQRCHWCGHIMRTLQERIVLASLLLTLVCAAQVGSAQGSRSRLTRLTRLPRSRLTRLPFPPQVASLPLPDDSLSGLLQRTKRSLLWRWNSMKPLGASCREHSECGTKYCRYSGRRFSRTFQDFQVHLFPTGILLCTTA